MSSVERKRVVRFAVAFALLAAALVLASSASGKIAPDQELSNVPGGSDTYDQLGDLTGSSNGGTQATYNQAAELTSFTQTGQNMPGGSYTYNGDGLRISKTVGSSTSHCVWANGSDGEPVLLSDGTNSYIYGIDDTPFEQISAGGTVTYLRQDQQGSIRVEDSTSGVTPTATESYLPYGQVSSMTGTVNTPFGYAGQYTDSESGLQHDRSRYYDPSDGQFIQRDPLAIETGQPYTYANDNPINAQDPSGEDPGLDAGLDDACLESVGDEGVCGVAAVGDTAEAVGEIGADVASEVIEQQSINQANYDTQVLAVDDGQAAEGRSQPETFDPATEDGAGSGVSFIAHPNGDVLPVPEGAEGPTPAENGNGFQFKGGSGGHGLDPRTTGVRIMDPVTSSPYQYPNGYASYLNESGQTVNPFTGRTVPNSDPFAHAPFGP